MDWRVIVFSVIGWVATIIVSFFSARFGASESKRQFKIKFDKERLLAAANIIDALQRLSTEAENIIEDVGIFEVSKGRYGVKRTSFKEVQPSPAMFADAAKLGGETVQRLLRLCQVC